MTKIEALPKAIDLPLHLKGYFLARGNSLLNTKSKSQIGQKFLIILKVKTV